MAPPARHDFQAKIGTGKAHSLYSFQAPPDGENPSGVVPVDGTLYGTCQDGATGFGTVFKFDRATRQETTVYTFTGGNDGAAPEGVPILVNGLLYGTTLARGAGNAGTVYSLDPATGTETTLYAFGGAGDGTGPSTTLTYANGLLYGTTSQGGAHGDGTVYSVDPTTGHEVVLHSFSGPDGKWPIARLSYLRGQIVCNGEPGAATRPTWGRSMRLTPRRARKPHCTRSPVRRTMAAHPTRRCTI
ncbi:MAG: choice-of-anchor tandem repeat GloVer-containing protein [Rhodospirillales bacterium]